MPQPLLLDLLHRCTVKISVPDGSWGTGFFVARGWVMTCGHVVKAYGIDDIQVMRDGEATHRVTHIHRSERDIDVAVLEVIQLVADAEPEPQPCVMLGDSDEVNDALYVYGFPTDFPQGAPTPGGLCDGPTSDQRGALIKFRGMQIQPGHSGAALLNQRTGAVCGVVNKTRGEGSDLGGVAVPVSEIWQQFSEVRAQNQGFYQRDERWRVAIEQWQKAGSQPLNITLEKTGIAITTEGHTVRVTHQATEAPVQPVPKQDSVSQIGPNPYKGLAAFTEKDADRYFGREAQVERVWERFQVLVAQSRQANAMPRFLPILGPSGSGKSSLARAGFIPELARRPLPGKATVRVGVLVPGSHPIEALAGILAKVTTDDVMPVAKTREFASELDLKNSAGTYDGLRRIVDLIPGIQDSPLVILVDQFEEVYSLCKEADEREAFIGNLLCAASDPSQNLSVVITLRSDFLGETQRHPELNQVIGSDESVIVPAMTEDELRRAIAEPAKQAGHPLDEALINLLLQDTEGREGALPLLQFALTRIWEELAQGKEPIETYREMGGVGGALAGKAQSIYDHLDNDEQDMARRIFVSLVQLGEGTRDTRRRAAIERVMAQTDDPQRFRGVIERFTDPGVRLMTMAAVGGEETAEVTHEALFDHWQQLNEWLDKGRDDIRFQRRLDEAAQLWDEGQRPDDRLWRGLDLDLLKDFHERAKAGMTDLQFEFYQASIKVEERRKQRQRWMLRGVVAAGVVFASLAGVAWRYAVQSQHTAQHAIARQLLAQSEQMFTLQPNFQPTATLLAVESFKRFARLKEAVIETDASMRQRLESLPPLITQVEHEDSVGSVSFSENSQYLATRSADGTAKLIEVQSGRELTTIEHEASVWSVSFSENSQYLATRSADGTAKLIEVQSGRELTTIEHEASVWSVSFSENSQYLATRSADGTAKLIEVQSGRELTTIEHEASVWSVSFSENSQYLATRSADGTAKLIEVQSGRELTTIEHEDSVWSVSFSENSQYLATSSADGTAKLIEVQSGRELTTIEHNGAIHDIHFSRDHQYFATSSRDETAKIIDLSTFKEIATIRHDSPIDSIRFSNDSQYVLTQAGTSVRISQIMPTHEIAATICPRMQQNLSAESWKRYIGPLATYEKTCDQYPISPSLFSAVGDLLKTNIEFKSHLSEDNIAHALLSDQLTASLTITPTDPQKYQEARSLLRYLRTLEPSADLYPKTAAVEQTIDVVIQKWRAAHQLNEGLRSLDQENSEQAWQKIRIAQTLDPDIEIKAHDWNRLCWLHIPKHQENPTGLNICVKIAEYAPKQGKLHDTLGIARALMGNKTGAIEAFQAYIAWSGSTPRNKKQRQDWIDALNTGKNPFTDELLEELNNL